MNYFKTAFIVLFIVIPTFSSAEYTRLLQVIGQYEPKSDHFTELTKSILHAGLTESSDYGNELVIVTQYEDEHLVITLTQSTVKGDYSINLRVLNVHSNKTVFFDDSPKLKSFRNMEQRKIESCTFPFKFMGEKSNDGSKDEHYIRNIFSVKSE